MKNSTTKYSSSFSYVDQVDENGYDIVNSNKEVFERMMEEGDEYLKIINKGAALSRIKDGIIDKYASSLERATVKYTLLALWIEYKAGKTEINSDLLIHKDKLLEIVGHTCIPLDAFIDYEKDGMVRPEFFKYLNDEGSVSGHYMFFPLF